jgi:hypothetical protein
MQAFIHKRTHSRQTGNNFKYIALNAMMSWSHLAHLFPALDSLHYELWIIQTKWYNLTTEKQDSVFQECKEHRKEGNLATHTFLPLPTGSSLCFSFSCKIMSVGECCSFNANSAHPAILLLLIILWNFHDILCGIITIIHVPYQYSKTTVSRIPSYYTSS